MGEVRSDTPAGREQLVEAVEHELPLVRNWLNKRGWPGSETRYITDTLGNTREPKRVRMVSVAYMISLRHIGPVKKAMYLAEDGSLYENNGMPVDLLSFPAVQDGYADPLEILLAALLRTRDG